MHLDQLGHLERTSSGKILNEPNKWLNSKKKHPYKSKKHHNGLGKPISNVSKRLIV
jgi:hypothetical protein